MEEFSFSQPLRGFTVPEIVSILLNNPSNPLFTYPLRKVFIEIINLLSRKLDNSEKFNSIIILRIIVSICFQCQRQGPQFNFPGNNGSPGSQNFQPFQPPAAPASTPREQNSAPANVPAPPRPIPAVNFVCPEKTGFFPHSKSCDKYYACENGTATLKTCGNGLVFDDADYMRENCAYPFSVDCGQRTDMEPPISTPNCPRLYGIFPHSTNCKVFYSCWNGEANRYDCPPGLAYDDEQRVCVWADLVSRCDKATLSDGFVCPEGGESDQPGHYTRHPHPTDCRKFYVCIDAVARAYGCSFGTVFNTDTLQCDEPENVQGCEKYYGDVDPKTAKKLKGQN